MMRLILGYFLNSYHRKPDITQYSAEGYYDGTDTYYDGTNIYGEQ